MSGGRLTAGGKPITLDKAINLLEHSMGQTRAYKQRQDFVVLELGDIQRALVAGDIEGAEESIKDRLGKNLKESKERVYNRELALKMAYDEAVKWLEKTRNKTHQFSGTCDCEWCQSWLTLRQVNRLAPDAFEPESKPAANA